MWTDFLVEVISQEKITGLKKFWGYFFFLFLIFINFQKISMIFFFKVNYGEVALHAHL